MHTHLRRAAGLLLSLALLGLAACDAAGAPAAPPTPTGSAAHSGHAAQAPAPGEPTGESVYNLESVWRDQLGRERTLGSLAGRVQVVSMVYTYCGRTCPQVLLDMKRIEGATGSGAGFVLVSIDPERDTPDRLRTFAEGARLDPARWTLLSGGDVLELAALLGVKYRRESATELSHSNVLVVLDRRGEIVHRQLGLGGEGVDRTAQAVRAALRPEP
ncbi:MAG TPA: SCO family protein [Longimicrobiaceae bacterium]|jgi:protein SCO1/2